MTTNQIVDVPLDQIEADYTWNSRSGNWTVDSGDEESTDFSDFVLSFEGPNKTILQKVPVDLMRNDGKDRPYFLVAGFRRHKAIETLAAKLHIEKPTIRAVIGEMSVVDARYNNLSENVNRQNLSPADFAWGVWQLKLDAQRNGSELRGTDIAKKLGRNQSYIDKMLNIMSKCRPEITRCWRETPKYIGVESMYALSKLHKDDQEVAFRTLLSDVELRESGDAKKKNGWIEISKRKAREYGSILGRLEGHGLITTDALDFDEHLDLVMEVRASAPRRIRNTLSLLMHKAYQTAKNECIHERSDIVDGYDEEE